MAANGEQHGGRRRAADLDFGVVGGDTEPHQAEGYREGLVHVDLGPLDPRYDPVRGVEAGRSGPHDGHPERPSAARPRAGRVERVRMLFSWLPLTALDA